jgi:hypothetical protein
MALVKLRAEYQCDPKPRLDVELVQPSAFGPLAAGEEVVRNGDCPVGHRDSRLLLFVRLGYRDGGTSVQGAPRCDAVMVQANRGRRLGPAGCALAQDTPRR